LRISTATSGQKIFLVIHCVCPGIKNNDWKTATGDCLRRQNAGDENGRVALENAMSIKFPNPTDKYVGSRVRMRRLMLHMSQERLADQLGLTFQQVQKYEKGTNRISASRLQEISRILEVPVPFFFEGAPQPGGTSRRSSDDGASLAHITDFLGNADGHALVKAFMKIKSAALRRSIVRMVEAIVSSD
jgi:transcriptional regulator with XRE-family HTH domain